MQSIAVGADGGRKGSWVSVKIRVSNLKLQFVDCKVWPDLKALLVWSQDAKTIGLDIPIGLPDAPEKGGRAAERAARALLGARASSVFSTPSRKAMEVAQQAGFENTIYPNVNRANAEASEHKLKLSKQAFFLLPRIWEVDRYLQTHPDDRVIETHPELAFRRLANRPVEPKKSFRGKLTRFCLLQEAGFPVTEQVLAMEDHPAASPDDVLDACACALTAARKIQGTAMFLPEPKAPRDGTGLPMALWY